ncbi:MAG TPA: electron transport complex subunit RsxE [Firmicutes bacterium]|nr:electron transport complex subunit RsxE [Bacillota bacterium]
MKPVNALARGLWRENPILLAAVGLCPALAATRGARDALAMGLSTLFVLVCATVVVTLFGRQVPGRVRVPCQLAIVATLAGLVDAFLAVRAPAIRQSLGIFVPLLAVNCLVLGRVSACAQAACPALPAMAAAVGSGLGFTWALVALGSVREILGSGTWFGVRLFGAGFVPWGIMGLPAGAFLTLGSLLAFGQAVADWRRAAADRRSTAGPAASALVSGKEAGR